MHDEMEEQLSNINILRKFSSSSFQINLKLVGLPDLQSGYPEQICQKGPEQN